MSLPSISSFTPSPHFVSPNQMVSNAKNAAITGLALYILSNIPTAAALNGKAYEKCMEICTKHALDNIVILGGCALVCTAALLVPEPPQVVEAAKHIAKVVLR